MLFLSEKNHAATRYGALMCMLVLSFSFANRYVCFFGLAHVFGIPVLSGYFLLLHAISAPYKTKYRQGLLVLTILVLAFFSGLSWLVGQILSPVVSQDAFVAIWEFRWPIEMTVTFSLMALISLLNVTAFVKKYTKHPIWNSLAQTLCLGLAGHAVMFVMGLFYPFQWKPLLRGNLVVFLASSCLGALLLHLINRQWTFSDKVFCDKRKNFSQIWVYQGLILFFCGACIFSNLLVVKQVMLGKWHVTAALFSYVFTFILTDVLSELYGEKRTKATMWAGFWSSIVMLCIVMLLSQFSCHPDSPTDEPIFGRSKAFVELGMVASLVAFLASQWVDIFLFGLFRKKTRGRYLWLRNNVATMISQAVDTLLFATVAWGLSIFSPGILPKDWWDVSYHEYIGKFILALLDTPLVYLLVYSLRAWTCCSQSHQNSPSASLSSSVPSTLE